MSRLIFIGTFFASYIVCTEAQITIEAPAELNRIIERHAAAHSLDEIIDGWVILIALDRDRRKVDGIQRDFKYKHPTYNSFLDWKFDNPNYRLTVGAFENETDAMPLLVQLRKEYPSAFQVKAKFPRKKLIEFRRIMNL